MAFFFPPSFRIVENALDAATLRQRVIANNIANVDTPGYKSQRVEFESILKEALQENNPTSFIGKRTDPRHLSIETTGGPEEVRASVSTDPTTWVENNGNNVDVEYEMTKMAENQIWYNALVEETNSFFTRLREVIKEGR
ncbi:MAG: flagellar basal body rod protein FlgB [Thermicanus sp.]|nr:flagellar basal body rod protein FlgB [Thermicanus sp.]